MNTLITVWCIVVILSVVISVFLDAIDVVDGNTSGFIVLCIAIPPVLIVAVIMYIIIQFHKLCTKHKDKIRKFLKLNKT